MEKRKGTRELQLTAFRRRAIFLFLVSVFFGSIWGCASPGEPIERKPPVPAAIDDLSAEQSGNAVFLTFTLPQETVEHRPLKQPPDVEIYRSFSPSAPANAVASEATPVLVVTIPAAMVDHYAEHGHIRYPDPLRAEDLKAHPNESASYTVRTRASAKKSSANSNVASLRVYPAAESIDDLQATAGNSSIALTWTAPQKTPVGPAPPIKAYRIYRADLPDSNVSAAQSSPAPAASVEPADRAVATVGAKPNPALAKLGDSGSTSYEDSQVTFGKRYAYAVRSVVEYSGEEVESGDSNVVNVTMRDRLPPAAPLGVIVVFVPAEGETPAHLELSWSISPETDVVGYNVYRSEGQGSLGTRVNPELLPTPAFRDMSTLAGRRYFYSVTAVDRSGNESPPSAAASGEVTAESQPQQ